MRIIWSPLAVDRASEIADYIAQDKPSAAEKWIDTVFSKVEQLKSSPEIGRIVPEIKDSQFRELIYGNYRIIYRSKPNKYPFSRFDMAITWTTKGESLSAFPHQHFGKRPR
jgi:toxin ParE1/3/4